MGLCECESREEEEVFVCWEREECFERGKGRRVSRWWGKKAREEGKRKWRSKITKEYNAHSTSIKPLVLAGMLPLQHSVCVSL